MMRVFALSCLSLLLFSCHHGEKIPDVSDIKVDITTQHFEQDFFACDSSNMYNGIMQLRSKYPQFIDIFFSEILESDPRLPADSINRYVGGFRNAFEYLYDSAEVLYKDFDPYENEIKNGLQFVKYYFPAYKLPREIITYIGPVEGTASFYESDDGILGVGLQQYLGKNFSLYQAPWLQETYPDYVSADFEPTYIAVNSMKNILNDIYPEKETDDPLVNRMVEKGKRLYVLSKFLPYKEEYKLIGYTEKQLSDCYAHESVIWEMFIQNSLLQITDPDLIKNYIGDGPSTAELGKGAPGNIGSFAGWQIVKKYMQKNDKTTLQQLLSTDDETIFQDARYKP
jgi:hypothetical protein